MSGKSTENRIGMRIGPYLGGLHDATPVVRFHHDSSYVTQLIAAAAGVPQMPQRRRSERRNAVSAYETASAALLPRTDRIKRNA